MPLMPENRKGNFTSRQKKRRDFNVKFTRHPTAFLQDRRMLPGHQAIQNKGRKSAPFKNPYNKNWGIQSTLRRAKESKENLPWARRSFKHYRREFSSESIRDTSSTAELAEWKKGFDIERLKLKKDAIIEQLNTGAHPDKVHMMAARPWSAPCGDPHQHDWAWGSCTLAAQCDGEYRIYRGDLYCGRSALVCCSVLYTTHDLYQGLDISFTDTETDSSGEKRKIDLGSVRLKRKKKHDDRIRRKRRRKRAKWLIKKKIRKVVHHLRKILNRAFRNVTSDRKRKMEALIKLIKHLRNKFHDERRIAIKKVHGDIEDVHGDLTKTLIQLDSVNAHFLINETFREFLRRYNISSKELRSLDSVNPKLLEYFTTRTGKISDGILRLLAATRRNVTVDLQNETKPLRYPLQQNVVRKLNDNRKELHYLVNANSASDVLLQNPNLNVLPRASLKYEINPSWRIDVTESSSPIQTSTSLGETSADVQSYREIDKNISEAVMDTRRAGTSFIFERKKRKKKPKRKDYLEYDIEYGALYM
ncbi:unnamed protein product [Arctia plantaginis]|uniref:Uncharacterized protein n=1 Tax=Arctia plantaginis TaxID=874455 RepID=A0A8S1AUU2_ARCPL|nr:unnamed protein product [Arctia plantaginis]